jgi:hypothetical protein
MIMKALAHLSEAGFILGSTYIGLKILPMYFQVQVVPEFDPRESAIFRFWASEGDSR